MDRLKRLAVAAAVAAVVSVVAAGPAVAAKGGNSDNAHACQQGGHENRFEAETGNPFKNAGDCTNDGAKGTATSLLTVTTDQYSCDNPPEGECWGVLSGSGLKPNSVVQVNMPPLSSEITNQHVDGNGNVSANLDAVCQLSYGPITASAITSGGATVQVGPITTPCN